jgi:hypothetical protein
MAENYKTTLVHSLRAFQGHTRKAINSLWSTQDPSIQARIDQAFRVEWCHLGIFGADCATIVLCFLPPPL